MPAQVGLDARCPYSGIIEVISKIGFWIKVKANVIFQPEE